MRDAKTVKVAGIHLAGPNSPKTTVVIMTGRWGEGNLKMESVHERLGPLHKLFSDERVFELLRREAPDRIMIDSPLTLPPCVACTRPSCPGVIACEDIAVAYMQKLIATPSGRRRKRPLNPQTQRVWDVEGWFEHPHNVQEPTYSANKAPLVVRAVTLQRRLNSLPEPLKLLETSIPHVLQALSELWQLEAQVAHDYRSFEGGQERRSFWVSCFKGKGWIDPASKVTQLAPLAQSVEVFSAWLAATLAYWHMTEQVTKPEHEFYDQQGWVYLPKLV